MTTSADEEQWAGDVLARSFQMYRELSRELRDRIADLRAGSGKAGARETLEAVQAHEWTMRTVIELEASLVTRRTGTGDGGRVELDFAAARAEIADRLARRGGA